ncbi:hypothetical protein DICA1_E12266 [Diutina catenulata]
MSEVIILEITPRYINAGVAGTPLPTATRYRGRPHHPPRAPSFLGLDDASLTPAQRDSVAAHLRPQWAAAAARYPDDTRHWLDVDDPGAVGRAVYDTFYHHLMVSPHKYRVVVVDHQFANPTKLAILDALLVHLRVKSVTWVPSALAVAVGSGATAALVVETGWRCTRVAAVVDLREIAGEECGCSATREWLHYARTCEEEGRATDEANTSVTPTTGNPTVTTPTVTTPIVTTPTVTTPTTAPTSTTPTITTPTISTSPTDPTTDPTTTVPNTSPTHTSPLEDTFLADEANLDRYLATLSAEIPSPSPSPAPSPSPSPLHSDAGVDALCTDIATAINSVVARLPIDTLRPVTGAVIVAGDLAALGPRVVARVPGARLRPALGAWAGASAYAAAVLVHHPRQWRDMQVTRDTLRQWGGPGGGRLAAVPIG